MTNDSYEKIDEGVKTDQYDDIVKRFFEFSGDEEPDIKKRLSLEKKLARYLNCDARSAMLVLNLVTELYNEN